MISLLLNLSADETKALAGLASRLDEQTCSPLANTFTTYGRTCELESVVMARAAAALAKALDESGRH